MPFLQPVATALPANRLSQADLRAAAAAMMGASLGTGAALEVFDNARIDGRALAMPLPWYFEPHGHKDRAEAFTRVGMELAEQAAGGALENAGVPAADLGGIVFASTTGIATPSLDARLVHRLGMPDNVVRMPLWGLGCAGGVAAVNRAAELAAQLAKPVLVVALELCTLSFDIRKAVGVGAGPDKKALVSAAIFADGCAGLVVTPRDRPGQPGLRHVDSLARLWPGTERVMGWDVTDAALEVVLDPGIPGIVRERMPEAVRALLQRHGITRPDLWALHPGGAKVLDAFAQAFDLSDAEAAVAAGVLRSHGNMSSPTVLFCLEAARRRMKPGDTALMAALGPGFATELALVQA